jgi:hypothetical protein
VLTKGDEKGKPYLLDSNLRQRGEWLVVGKAVHRNTLVVVPTHANGLEPVSTPAVGSKHPEIVLHRVPL